MNYQIRYGKNKNGDKKNTLWTLEENGVIYFGISRCNIRKDKFIKKMGIRIATDRALTAKEENSAHTFFGSVALHKSMLRGHVRKEEVISLLKYFDKIDITLCSGGLK